MFAFSSITQYLQQLHNGSTTCAEAVDYYLQRIDENSALNAFVDVYAGEARLRAAELDRQRLAGEPTGLLHGVVIALKDVLCYQGHTVTAASRMLSGFTSVYTATAVQRLLDAGAIIIGNCNCDEFAMGSTNENSAYGAVRNAADTSRVPGGSSGGSAVAVQADLCMLSLGSDTGGSVRQPADFCGIIGLKPTYGTISRYGLIAYASSFDQIGIFGKQVADIALLLQVMSGKDPMDSTSADSNFTWEPAQENKPYRIAYFETAITHPSVDPEITGAITETVNRLKADGHTVEAVPFSLLDYIVPAYYILTTAEASSNLSRYDGVRFGHRTTEPVTDLTEFYRQSRSEGFGPEVQKRILLGSFVLSAGYYDAYFTKAQQVRRLLVEQIDAIFADYDAVILPTVPETAFRIGEKTADPVAMYLADIFTVFANLTGTPALSIPLYRHSNGMPFGLQLITKAHDELTLLQLGDSFLQRYRAH